MLFLCEEGDERKGVASDDGDDDDAQGYEGRREFKENNLEAPEALLGSAGLWPGATFRSNERDDEDEHDVGDDGNGDGDCDDDNGAGDGDDEYEDYGNNGEGDVDDGDDIYHAEGGHDLNDDISSPDNRST